MIDASSARAATMRAQCEHLLTMSLRPEITIQVIENAQGICCAFGQAFVILSFDHQGDVVYLEEVWSAKYVRKKEHVDTYSLTFDHLRASALPDARSAELIERIAHGE